MKNFSRKDTRMTLFCQNVGWGAPYYRFVRRFRGCVFPPFMAGHVGCLQQMPGFYIEVRVDKRGGHVFGEDVEHEYAGMFEVG